MDLIHNPNYHFFLKGPFSQWFPSTFTVHSNVYCCAEQYMMWGKATLFEDYETAHHILNESSPKIHKKLGRQVKNFNHTLWDFYKEKIVLIGNLEKFRQNAHLRSFLLNTGDTVLVECNPYDCIWGIGLGLSDPKIYNSSNWKGQNILGKILTRVKLVLRLEEG